MISVRFMIRKWQDMARDHGCILSVSVDQKVYYDVKELRYDMFECERCIVSSSEPRAFGNPGGTWIDVEAVLFRICMKWIVGHRKISYNGRIKVLVGQYVT
jgi:hypothetical protein